MGKHHVFFLGKIAVVHRRLGWVGQDGCLQSMLSTAQHVNQHPYKGKIQSPPTKNNNGNNSQSNQTSLSWLAGESDENLLGQACQPQTEGTPA